jgi:hypothetical protein
MRVRTCSRSRPSMCPPLSAPAGLADTCVMLLHASMLMQFPWCHRLADVPTAAPICLH